jgi:hypothetical protein
VTHNVRRDIFSHRRSLSNLRSSRSEHQDLSTFAFIKSMAAFLAIALVVTIAIRFAMFIGQ